MPSSISIATLCHVCGTNFVNRSSLIEHLRLEHGKSFDEENTNEIANQNELEKENDEKSDKTKDLCVCTKSKCKKVHEKKKQFHCKQCDKYFTLKGSLTTHNNKVHEEKPFGCKKCDKSFTSEKLLRTHDSLVHRSPKCQKCGLSFYICDLCNSEFNTKDALEKHQAKVYKGERIYQCSICKTCFLRKNGLKNHVKNTHEDIIQYKCNNEIAKKSHVCNINHIDNSALKKQLPVHEGKDTKEKAIKQKQKMDMKEEQKKIVHEGKDTKEKAIIQKQKKDMKEEQEKIVHEGKDTKEKAIIQKRKKDMKEEQIKNCEKKMISFPCEKCQFNFLSLKSLKNHFNNIHIPQKCKKCDKHFLKEELQRHIETVHEEKTKCKKGKKRELQQENDNDMKQAKKIKGSHSCPVCKEFFESQSLKIKHIASMHPERPLYQCHYCQKNFDREYNCKQHISNIHEQKKPFHCKICNKDFFQERGLKKHNAVVHEGKDIYQKQENDMNDENEKNVKQEKRKDMKQKEKITFQCKICSIRFEQESQLKEHMINNHEGKKPFHCEICNSGFVKHNLLKKHMKIHEESKPQQVNNTNQASNDIQYEVDDKEQSFVGKYRVEGNLEDYKDSGDPGDSGDSESLGDWESFGSDLSLTISEIDFLIKESE